MATIEKQAHWPAHLSIIPQKYQDIKVWPKISVVTPSYNQGKFIEETIQSVLHQNYPNLEYIIIDGGSNDETIEVIKKYETKLSYWISEPDKGQAAAINKGLAKCTGQIFNWINSDDLLEEHALFTIAEAFLKQPELKLLAGGCCHFSGNFAHQTVAYVRDLTFDGLISEKSYFQQPSQWLVLEQIKNLKLNENLHYSFDWGMILNLNLATDDLIYLPENLSYFREHEEAKTTKNGLLFKRENLAIVTAYAQSTNSISKKIKLANYIFRLSRYLKVIDYLESPSKQGFKNFLAFGLKSPSLFLFRFYLGQLKILAIGKEIN